jgi:bifunctional DNA-binding transcriptional regulator/antitoxin component of YhaV-PrlF toxin-antitoxin module
MVISLPAVVVTAAGLGLGDRVIVVADPESGRIIVTPTGTPGVRAGFAERIDRFIEDYRPSLETLAGE